MGKRRWLSLLGGEGDKSPAARERAGRLLIDRHIRAALLDLAKVEQAARGLGSLLGAGKLADRAKAIQEQLEVERRRARALGTTAAEE